MYKIRLIAVFVLIFMSCQISRAQLTEGKVIYDLSYPESGLDQQTLDMLPGESTTFFKNDKMRIDMKMGMGMNSSVIMNNAKKEVHVLMDMMGNKMDMLITEKDVDKEMKDEGEYKIVKTNDVRKIAGYNCKKAVITAKDGKEFSVWYTNDIIVKNANWNNQFKSIDGFLMEFRMNQNGLTVEMSAREVASEKVTDEIFNIPPGYKKVTRDDLKKMSEGK